MKNILRIFLLLSITFFNSNITKGETQDFKKNQFGVGIENTRLVYGKYIYNNHLTAKLDISVYSERFSLQYARGTVGYQTKIKMFDLSGEAFFGSAFNGNYVNTGAVISASATFVKRLLVDAKLAPWYDSGFGYTTCFQARIGCKITKNIDIRVGYSTIPEYRMSEKRIIGGFDFKVSHLYVSPYLSVGTNSNYGGKNIRVLFGFGYMF